MKLEEGLKNIGLKSSETKVYLYLLENGISTPPQIAKGTGIARTNTYHIIRDLSKKGLIEEQKKRKRFAYLPTDPAALLRTLERRKEVVEQLLPDLRALHKTQINKPNIHFFEGIEEIKEIFFQLLETKEILGIASTEKLFPLDINFFKSHGKKFRERQIVFKDILSSKSKTAAKETRSWIGPLYEYKFLPESHGEFPIDILIWNDNIALIALEEPIFGTVFSNQTLADAFREIFKFMWDRLSTSTETEH